MTTTLRERRELLLRDEIRQAAEQLLAEHGYNLMSMDDLAARAGISKPTLYRYFPSKDEVVIAVVTSHLRQVVARIEDSSAGRSPLERLVDLLRATLRHALEQRAMPINAWGPELFRLICQHEDSLSCLRQIHDATRALAVAAIEAGEIDPTLNADAVVLSIHSLAGVLRLSKIDPSSELKNPEQVADSLVRIFARGVRNGERSADSADYGD